MPVSTIFEISIYGSLVKLLFSKSPPSSKKYMDFRNMVNLPFFLNIKIK